MCWAPVRRPRRYRRSALLVHPERGFRPAAVSALDAPVELSQRAVDERLPSGQDFAKITIAFEEVIKKAHHLARPPVRKPALRLLTRIVKG